MSEIIISLEERNVKGETTRQNLVQALGLLQQSLKESLSREYASFREEVEMLGMSIDELDKMQRRPLVVTYTHPFDPTKTWHGRGRRPGWVAAFFPEVRGKNTPPNANGDAEQEKQEPTGEQGSAAAGQDAASEERSAVAPRGASGKSAQGSEAKTATGDSPGKTTTED